MSARKKRVLLTGASGSMGGQALKELLRRRDKCDIVLLLRPSKQNRAAFAKYDGQPGLSIVWGDLCNPDDVLKAVNGIDHILHPAALIAPEADGKPKQCRMINFGGTANIIAAIKKQPDNGDNIRLVYIGSVAAYGDRLPPIQWINVGDPLKPSVGDYYATTKIAAERAVIDSGINHWAIMRQTYIAIPNALSLMDPIMFHQPVNTHIELITSEDAGYGLVQTTEAPDEFYGRVYNMGGGPLCRVIFLDYMARMMKMFGLGEATKIMPLNWFALRNFHCGWYEDSDVLNNYLGHWRHSLQDHYKEVEASIPWYLRILKPCTQITPSSITGPFARAFMRWMADPLHWIESNDEEKIKAFFGSREKWQSITTWKDYVAQTSDPNPPKRPKEAIPDKPTLEYARALAQARGGQCLSNSFTDLKTKLQWKCGFGHEFEGSPRLMQAGHWCPKCAAPPWNYDELAKVDPLLARFYYNNHEKDEHQKVDYLYCPYEPEVVG